LDSHLPSALAFLKAESEWDGPMFMYAAAVTVCSEIHPWCGPYHFSSRGLRGDRAVTVKKCDNSTISLEFSSTGKSTMKISIKNLQQESFQVEIAPTSTVSFFSANHAFQQNSFPLAGQGAETENREGQGRPRIQSGAAEINLFRYENPVEKSTLSLISLSSLIGKILEDSSQISSLNIDEKKFIVCLVTKAKDAPPLDVTPSDPTDVPVPEPVAEEPTETPRR
jgi:hypothetical protein